MPWRKDRLARAIARQLLQAAGPVESPQDAQWISMGEKESASFFWAGGA